MSIKMEDITITEDLFLNIQNFIEENTGIYIPVAKKYLLEHRFLSILKREEITTFDVYFQKVEQSKGSFSPLLYDEFVDLVSTHETSFFRYANQMKVFTEEILTEYIAKNSSNAFKNITIYSCGASTGEELYTIAMILKNLLGKEIESWNVRIIGIDISTHSIAKAKEGVYSNYTIRYLPEEYKKYFDIDGTTCSVKQEIKDLVEFSILNMADLKALEASMPLCDIIFCRNVLIYFKPKLVSKIVHVLYEKLIPEGLFLVGHSENIRNLIGNLVPYSKGESMIYIKKTS